MDPRLAEVIRFLNRERVRATYGAVADFLGVSPRSMGARLGPRTIEELSLNREQGNRAAPTDYKADELHPELMTNPGMITTAEELRRRMKLTEGAGVTLALRQNLVL